MQFLLIELPGCQLLSSFELLLVAQVSDSAGQATSGLTIPDNASLIGLNLYSQWIVSGAPNPSGLMTTNGVLVPITG